MLWSHYGTLQDVTERYEAVTKCCGVLQNATEVLQKRYRALRNTMECCGTLQKHFWTLWSVTRALLSHYGSVAEALWGIAEHYGTLRSDAEFYGTLQKY